MRILMILIVSIATFIIVGCQSDSETEKNLNDMTKEAGNKVEQLAEQTVNLKDEYVAKAEEKLGQIATKLSDWKSKAGNLSAATKPMAEKSLATLESEHGKAVSVLGKLKDSDVTEWKDQVPAMDEAISGVTSAMKSAESFF